MDIMELGAIGELVGGVAVLVTLIYLAVQVRQGNDLERAESQRAFVRDWCPAVFTPLMDPAMASVIRRGSGDFESLSGDEKMMMTGWWGGSLLLTEATAHLHRDGLINEEFAKATEQRAVSILQQSGANRWWSTAQNAYTPAFTHRINGLLTDADRPPSFDQVLPWMSSDGEEA